MNTEIKMLELYNPNMNMGITLNRSKERQYKLKKQLTPNRNIYTTTTYKYHDSDEIKREIFCEIVNGYEVRMNLLGLDFIDSILNYTPELTSIDTSSPTPEFDV